MAHVDEALIVPIDPKCEQCPRNNKPTPASVQQIADPQVDPFDEDVSERLEESFDSENIAPDVDDDPQVDVTQHDAECVDGCAAPQNIPTADSYPHRPF